MIFNTIFLSFGILLIFSEVSTLNIIRPKIIVSEHDSKVTTLKCLGNKGKYCMWTKDEINGTSTEIVVNGSFSIKNFQLTNKPEDGDCSLNVRDVRMEDSANLTCKILPSPYSFTAVWELEVGRMPLSIYIKDALSGYGIIPKDEIQLDENGNVVLTCEVTFGKPPAIVHWIGDIKPDDKISETTQELESYFEVSSTITMKINKTKGKPERTVTCVSFHELYPQKQELETVTVGLPYATKTVNIFTDETTTRWKEITCGEADGIPEPNYRWQFKGLNSESWQNFTDINTATLNDYGEYQCLAGNHLNGDKWATSSTKLILTEEGVLIVSNSDEDCTM